VVADQHFVFVGQGRDAFGHADGGAGGNALDAEGLGHAEGVLDLVVGVVIAQVKAQEAQVDAGVVELPADRLEDVRGSGQAPFAQFGGAGVRGGLFFRGDLPAGPARCAGGSAAARSRGGAAPGGGREAGVGGARGGFHAVGHQFHFVNPNLQNVGDDLVDVRHRAEAIRDDSDLNPVETGVGRRHGLRQGDGGQGQSSYIASRVRHASIFAAFGLWDKGGAIGVRAPGGLGRRKGVKIGVRCPDPVQVPSWVLRGYIIQTGPQARFVGHFSEGAFSAPITRSLRLSPMFWARTTP
jgi:hypothetical protein